VDAWISKILNGATEALRQVINEVVETVVAAIESPTPPVSDASVTPDSTTTSSEPERVADRTADEDASELTDDKIPEVPNGMPKVDWRVELTPQRLRALRSLTTRINARISKDNAGRQYWNGDPADWPSPIPLMPDRNVGLEAYLASDRTELSLGVDKNWHAWWEMPAFARCEGVTPVLLAKVLHYFGHFGGNNSSDLFRELHACTGQPSLLELAAIRQGLGLPPGVNFVNYEAWPEADIAPFVALYSAEIAAGFRRPDSDTWHRPAGRLLYRAFSAMPIIPPAAVEELFAIALGTSKRERGWAQYALAKVPEKEVRIVAALSHEDACVREVAARWLGQLHHTPATADLESALMNETNDRTTSVLTDALEKLGQPAARYFDRRSLEASASQTTANSVPFELSWFPFDQLPVVSWADTGETVAPDVIRWLVIRAFQLKSPEPDALLRFYSTLLQDGDREDLGRFVLDAWLARDLQMAHDVATQFTSARREAGTDFEIARMLPFAMSKPTSHALASKGLVAVAAACSATGAAETTWRYINRWHGYRVGQGQALLGMLAWIDEPSATQVLLTISTRFRTRGLQKEAVRLSSALAARRGWTPDELADRSIADAGLDADGRINLSYGARSFKARLLPSLALEITGPDSSVTKTLGEMQPGDDAGKVKEAMMALSATRRTIKATVRSQTVRLYEAMCLQRRWTFGDWQQYLQLNPIVRHVIEQLVWAEIDSEGNVVRTFRSTETAQLVDAENRELLVDATGLVVVAHESLLEANDASAWMASFDRHGVTPLFAQFGRGLFVLADDQGSLESITEYEGYVVSYRSLRERAVKLGYTRGLRGDHGETTQVERYFRGLDLVAVISFTRVMDDSNEDTALLALSFARTRGSHRVGLRIPLRDVPSLLLSECHSDLRSLADRGSGFNPEWRKTTGY
jgi:Domain of unknown function (DUF4132)